MKPPSNFVTCIAFGCEILASGIENRSDSPHELIDLFVFLTSYSALFFLLAKRFYDKKASLFLLPGFFDVVETSAIVLHLTGTLAAFPPWIGYFTAAKWTGVFVVTAMILAKARLLFSKPKN